MTRKVRNSGMTCLKIPYPDFIGMEDYLASKIYDNVTFAAKIKKSEIARFIIKRSHTLCQHEDWLGVSCNEKT